MMQQMEDRQEDPQSIHSIGDTKRDRFCSISPSSQESEKAKLPEHDERVTARHTTQRVTLDRMDHLAGTIPMVSSHTLKQDVLHNLCNNDQASSRTHTSAHRHTIIRGSHDKAVIQLWKQKHTY